MSSRIGRISSSHGRSAPDSERVGRRSIAAIPRRFRHLLSLDDFERAARRRLPRPLYGYARGGVEDEEALRGSARAYDDFVLLPRVCAGVEGGSTQTELMGWSWEAPFGIAPMGICALNGYRADLAMAEAARRAGIPMILSGSSLISMEEIAAANPAVWFQAYVPPDAERLNALLDRVRACGIGTLVITVDSPVGSNRENNLRTGFSSPLKPSLRLAWDGMIRPRWLVSTFFRTLLHHGMPHFENLYAYRGAPIISRSVQREFGGRAKFNWDDFRSIRAAWKGPLVIKGVLHPEDARIAAGIGADAIVVSSHGGRQLDAAVAPLHVLPAVCEAVPHLPVIVDSGVRRGTDVVKAIGLGAKFVLVGRPFNYAAAVGGVDGVDYAISILKGEVLRTLGQIGVKRIAGINPGQIVRRGPLGRTPLGEEAGIG